MRSVFLFCSILLSSSMIIIFLILLSTVFSPTVSSTRLLKNTSTPLLSWRSLPCVNEIDSFSFRNLLWRSLDFGDVALCGKNSISGASQFDKQLCTHLHYFPGSTASALELFAQPFNAFLTFPIFTIIRTWYRFDDHDASSSSSKAQFTLPDDLVKEKMIPSDILFFQKFQSKIPWKTILNAVLQVHPCNAVVLSSLLSPLSSIKLTENGNSASAAYTYLRMLRFANLPKNLSLTEELVLKNRHIFNNPERQPWTESIDKLLHESQKQLKRIYTLHGCSEQDKKFHYVGLKNNPSVFPLQIPISFEQLLTKNSYNRRQVFWFLMTHSLTYVFHHTKPIRPLGGYSRSFDRNINHMKEMYDWLFKQNHEDDEEESSFISSITNRKVCAIQNAYSLLFNLQTNKFIEPRLIGIASVERLKPYAKIQPTTMMYSTPDPNPKSKDEEVYSIRNYYLGFTEDTDLSFDSDSKEMFWDQGIDLSQFNGGAIQINQITINMDFPKLSDQTSRSSFFFDHVRQAIDKAKKATSNDWNDIFCPFGSMKEPLLFYLNAILPTMYINNKQVQSHHFWFTLDPSLFPMSYNDLNMAKILQTAVIDKNRLPPFLALNNYWSRNKLSANANTGYYTSRSFSFEPTNQRFLRDYLVSNQPNQDDLAQLVKNPLFYIPQQPATVIINPEHFGGLQFRPLTSLSEITNLTFSIYGPSGRPHIAQFISRILLHVTFKLWK